LTPKNTLFDEFLYPVIPALRRGQSRNSGLAKTAGIPGLHCKH